MNVTIAHLYYDLLNLYGESGNVKALKMNLEDQGIQVTVRFFSLQDEINLKDVDLIYIGSGTEENQKLALKHMLKYKQEFKQAIEQGTYFLVTGNALDLFGESIIDTNHKKYKALGCFHYSVKQEEFRIVGESIATCPLLKHLIIGFQNRSSVMKNVKEDFLFELQQGDGYEPKIKQEGILSNHFYGSYLIGPLLIRNPEFLKYLIKQLITTKNKNFKFQPFHLTLENKAHDHFLQNNTK